MIHRFADLSSGIRMHYVLAKELNPALPTVLFVHGFPELWVSWKELMETVAQTGRYNAVAMDMRGYGETDCPRASGAYKMKYLTGDLAGLMDHLKVPKAFLIGHDNGGLVVWSFIFHYESRCLGIGSFNTPLAVWGSLKKAWEDSGFKGPMEFLATLPPEQCGQMDYQLYYQIPHLAEDELDRDVERTIHAFFRSQISPSKEERHENMKIGMRTAKARKDNNRGVLFHTPAVVPRDPLWSKEEMDTYIRAFEKNGFAPAIHWYRNFDYNIMYDASLGITDDTVSHVPCLMVTAEYDMVLTPESSKGMEKRLPNLTRAHVTCGHWTQREAEKEIQPIVVNWLDSIAQKPNPRL